MTYERSCDESEKPLLHAAPRKPQKKKEKKKKKQLLQVGNLVSVDALKAFLGRNPLHR